MAAVFTQVDSSTGCAAADPTGAWVNCNTPRKRNATEGADPGTSDATITMNIPGDDAEAAINFDMTPGEAYGALAAGTVTSRLRVTTANVDLAIHSINVSRLNSSCVLQDDLGTRTFDFGTETLGGVQTYAHDITCVAASSFSATDIIRITYNITNLGGNGETLTFVPDQDIDTPWAQALGAAGGGQFVQTNTVKQCGTPTTDIPAASGTARRECIEDGVAGTVNRTVSLAASTGVFGGIFLGFVPGSAYVAGGWAAGNWEIPFNVVTANADLEWDSVYIRRFNSSCTNIELIGSATALGISLATTGIKSHTVAGSAVASPSATDRVEIVIGIKNLTGNVESFVILPNQTISTPLTAGGASGVPRFMNQYRRRRSGLWVPGRPVPGYGICDPVVRNILDGYRRRRAA